MHQTGFHGVQIDEAYGPAGGVVQQDVVDLGIAVYGPLGQDSGQPGLLQDRSPAAPLFNKRQGILYLG